jgi:hypothetical protein
VSDLLEVTSCCLAVPWSAQPQRFTWPNPQVGVVWSRFVTEHPDRSPPPPIIGENWASVPCVPVTVRRGPLDPNVRFGEDNRKIDLRRCSGSDATLVLRSTCRHSMWVVTSAVRGFLALRQVAEPPHGCRPAAPCHTAAGASRPQRTPTRQPNPTARAPRAIQRRRQTARPEMPSLRHRRVPECIQANAGVSSRTYGGSDLILFRCPSH